MASMNVPALKVGIIADTRTVRATLLSVLTAIGAGQRIYFYGNHPIRLVRLVGLVVAFDVFPNRFVFILDDSSGSNIEVTCGRPTGSLTALPNIEREQYPPKSIQEKDRSDRDAEWTGTTALGNVLSLKEIDIGTVVKVKGQIGEFRGEKQILLERIWIVGTTNEEAVCWVELCEFKAVVLDKAWVIDEKDEKKAKRRAEGKGTSRDERARNNSKNHRLDKVKKAIGRDSERRSRPDKGRRSKRTKYGSTTVNESATTRQEHIEQTKERNGDPKQLPKRSEKLDDQKNNPRATGSNNSEALHVTTNKKISGPTSQPIGNHCGGETYDLKKHPSHIHSNANLRVKSDALHMHEGPQAHKRKDQENAPSRASAGEGIVQDKVFSEDLVQVDGELERDRSWAEGKFDALGF